MTIEITSTDLKKGILIIYAIDCSEENLQKIERTRTDIERELKFVFDTTDYQVYNYLTKWLKRQKATKECKTYGQALNSVLGTITTISGYYLEFD